MGFRRPILSDKAPQIGLAIAQQTIITEQTDAALVGCNPKRTLRNGAPHSPVNASIGPTIPPWARKISHVLRYPKILLKPVNRAKTLGFSRRCSAEGA